MKHTKMTEVPRKAVRMMLQKEMEKIREKNQRIEKNLNDVLAKRVNQTPQLRLSQSTLCLAPKLHL